MKLPSANHVKTEDADSESVLDGRRLLEILRILCDTPDPERSSDYDEQEEKTILGILESSCYNNFLVY